MVDITNAQVGPLLSASLVGVLFGAAFIGPLGDRLGRKRLIIGGCSACGVLPLLIVVLLQFLLPESPAFMARRAQREATRGDNLGRLPRVPPKTIPGAKKRRRSRRSPSPARASSAPMISIRPHRRQWSIPRIWTTSASR